VEKLFQQRGGFGEARRHALGGFHGDRFCNSIEREPARCGRTVEQFLEQIIEKAVRITHGHAGGEAANLQGVSAESLDLDPGRLAAVQERLDEIHAALKRFGPTEADLRRNLARVTEELATAEAGADTEALAAQLAQATEAAAVLGRKLLRARAKASERC
jgi:DNA repair protein RecN (Recombination protein N)